MHFTDFFLNFYLMYTDCLFELTISSSLNKVLVQLVYSSNL